VEEIEIVDDIMEFSG